MKLLSAVAWIFLLSACAKLDAPQPGRYRAELELAGGKAPLLLQIDGDSPQLRVALVNGDALLDAADATVREHQLHATLPNGAGEIQARFRSKTLHGEWRLRDAQGNATVLHFSAKLNAHYRFVEQPSTDNADVSGDWTLHNTGHIGAPVLQLTQTHDAIDGSMQLPGSAARMIFGQVHGDDVYLTAIGNGEVWLLRGRVNAQGNLQGQLWINAGAAQSWSAQRQEAHADAAVAVEPNDAPDQTRTVAFPWAIPTK